MGLWYRMYLWLKDLKFQDIVKNAMNYLRVEIDHGLKLDFVLRDVLFYLKQQKSIKVGQVRLLGN